MELPKDLSNEIWDYCRVNNISNIEAFTIKMVRQGFTIEKYGATPNTPIPKEETSIPVLPIEITKENTKDIYGE